MTKANEVMDNFMKKLGNGVYKKENQPNDGPVFDEGFVAAQLKSYSDLLDSNIISDVLQAE